MFLEIFHSKYDDVYSFGIFLLELASGRRPVEKLSSTVKQSIVDWALPLVCKKKFSELADPRLNGNYVEEELRRVALISCTCMCSGSIWEETNHA